MKKLNRRIRIANIIEEGRIGGPQIRIAMTASAIHEKIETTVIFPKNNSEEFRKYCNFLGVKYLSLPLTTIRRNWIAIVKYFIFFPFEVIMLSNILKKNCFDIVHISGGSWQFKGLFAAKLASIKVVWELNDTFTPFVIRCIFFLLSNFAHSFIFASSRTKKYYKKYICSKKENFLIQSPVNVSHFDPNKSYFNNNYFKKKIKRKIVIGTVANISPVKNLELLIRAASNLSDYSNKIVFIVIGSIFENQRNYYKFLNNMVKNLDIKNFFFLGSKKDVRPKLNAIDIYVCSSKYESSPLSIWEAMSMKKAIVTTKVGDVSRFIVSGVNGFVVKVNDPLSMAKKIKLLIDSVKLRKKFGKISRKIAINKLDLNICARLHIKAYQSIFNLNKHNMKIKENKCIF